MFAEGTSVRRCRALKEVEYIGQREMACMASCCLEGSGLATDGRSHASRAVQEPRLHHLREDENNPHIPSLDLSTAQTAALSTSNRA
jgi:hypothetical protein